MRKNQITNVETLCGTVEQKRLYRGNGNVLSGKIIFPNIRRMFPGSWSKIPV